MSLALLALSMCFFWLGRDNYILLVCDIKAAPAHNPGVQLAKQILVEAKLILLPIDMTKDMMRGCYWVFLYATFQSIGPLGRCFL